MAPRRGSRAGIGEGGGEAWPQGGGAGLVGDCFSNPLCTQILPSVFCCERKKTYDYTV